MSEIRTEVRELMTTEIHAVERNDPLVKADRLMEENQLRHVPVLDEYGQLCGIVSHRDIARGALVRALGFGAHAEKQLLDEMKVKEVMSEDPYTAAPGTLVEEAARAMLDHKIGCLPVVEGDQLIGILTETDFLRLISEGQCPTTQG